MTPWLASRWERDSRYYELHLRQDLFGTRVLTRVWGGKGTALEQIRHDPCESYAAGVARHAEAERVKGEKGISSKGLFLTKILGCK